MTHIQVMLEGIPHFLDDYIKRLRHTKVRVENTAYQVHVREIRIIDLIVEDKAVEETKKILPGKAGPSGAKVRAITKMVKLLGKPVGVEAIPPEQCGEKYREWATEYGDGGHINVIPLGIVRDRKRQDGRDYQ